MKISFVQKFAKQNATIILPFFEGDVDYDSISFITANPVRPDFTGGANELLVLYNSDNKNRIFLLGLGQHKPNNPASKYFRKIAHSKLSDWKGSTLTLLLEHLPEQVVFQAVHGITLAGYTIGLFKTSKESQFSTEKLRLAILHTGVNVKSLVTEASHTGLTQIEMMKLVNSPANQKTPSYIAKYVTESGKKYGYTVKVIRGPALKKANLEALIAVGQGSINPPVLIQVEYKPLKSSKKAKLGLVGKGITFDTGGLSIKSSQNLHYMKSDMGGAAAVIGAIELAAKLKLNIHVVGILPMAENSVDANSIRPGDIINSHSGKTIEIIDTDCEGRLILADGLSFIQQKYQPETIIDIATLTGDCVRTFGYACGGLFSNNEALSKQLLETGLKINEKLWPLPLWDDYSDNIVSDLADVRNYSAKPIAGAISAAKFIEYFVNDKNNWAHLDVAGVAFGDSEFSTMKSATGYGVRLLVELMKSLISKNNEKQK